jgi:exosortase
LYAPTWRWLVVRWWYDPNYGHAFLVLPVALFLAWQQRERLRRVVRRPGWVGLLVLGVAVAVHVVALAGDDYVASALTIPVAVAGLLWLLHGLPLLRQLWFPVAFLVFVAPFPWGEVLDARLQALTTALAGWLLGLVGVEARVVGAEISLAGSTFEVGAACSGLRSTMALLTVGTVAAYLLDGPRWARGLLVPATVPIALVSNLARVVSLLLVARRFGARVALDCFHLAAGVLLFLCAVGLFLGLARVMGCGRGQSGGVLLRRSGGGDSRERYRY